MNDPHAPTRLVSRADSHAAHLVRQLLHTASTRPFRAVMKWTLLALTILPLTALSGRAATVVTTFFSETGSPLNGPVISNEDAHTGSTSWKFVTGSAFSSNNMGITETTMASEDFDIYVGALDGRFQFYYKSSAATNMAFVVREIQGGTPVYVFGKLISLGAASDWTQVTIPFTGWGTGDTIPTTTPLEPQPNVADGPSTWQIEIRNWNGSTGTTLFFDDVAFTSNEVSDSVPSITTTSLAEGMIGTPYSQALTAIDGDGALIWSLDSGSLPAGLSLSPDGIISGIPTSEGTSNFTIHVADSDANTGPSDEDTQVLSITVNAAPLTAFVTGQTLGSLRNDFSNWVGFRFTVGSSNITVGELGRWVVSGNSGTHAVKLVLASTGADVSGGSVSITT
jgi:hypothetical protein